jgi:hypothetical protein
MTQNTPTSSGYTFRDDLGVGSNQLHYVEIDLENSTQNVANTIVLDNRARLNITDPEVTLVGGFNEQNYLVIANENIVGVGVDTTENKSDSTSITTYGVRQAGFDTNAGLSDSVVYNLVANPSNEYSDTGFSGSSSARIRRRKPSQEAFPFTAYIGEWSVRARAAADTNQININYTGGESNAIQVQAGTTYYFKVQALRGTVSQSNTRVLARIVWLDDEESEISRINSANTNLTNANQWYQIGISGTAPVGAITANVILDFTRASGQIRRGDRLWADAFYMSKTNGTYFDGDFANTDTDIYGWTGGVGLSNSFKAPNNVDNIADAFLAAYSTTSMRASRIRWNAQEDLTAVSSLTVGKSISLVYDGTTTTYRIIGIDGNVDPERYMIDYYLVKV